MPQVEGQEVSKGDVVGFKSDVEQYGEITGISRNSYKGWDLTLKAICDGGFDGDYIGGQETTIQHSLDCWID